MARTYQVVEDYAGIEAYFNTSTPFQLWAHLQGRQDVQVLKKEDVQLREDKVFVNAGEWDRTGKLNEEWLQSLFFYIKHPCDGCHYPPDMCCMAPGMLDDEEELSDEEIDAWQQYFDAKSPVATSLQEHE